jgi:hypothetical protein
VSTATSPETIAGNGRSRSPATANANSSGPTAASPNCSPGELDWFTLYYDPRKKILSPLTDHLSAYAAIITVPYIYPADRAFGQRLYELSMRRQGWNDLAKYHQPTLEGVDYPALGIIQADYEPETSTPVGAHLRRHAFAPPLAHHLTGHQPPRPLINDRQL